MPLKKDNYLRYIFNTTCTLVDSIRVFAITSQRHCVKLIADCPNHILQGRKKTANYDIQQNKIYSRFAEMQIRCFRKDDKQKLIVFLVPCFGIVAIADLIYCIIDGNFLLAICMHFLQDKVNNECSLYKAGFVMNYGTVL